MRHRARLTIGLPALLIAVLLITALLLATCDGGDVIDCPILEELYA